MTQLYGINNEGFYIGEVASEKDAYITTTQKPTDPSDRWDFTLSKWIPFGSKPEHGLATSAQLKAELADRGMLSVVDETIASHPEFEYDEYWRTGDVFHAADLTLNAILSTLDLSTDQIWEMFIAAASRDK
jgi:hypothetical protein